MKFAINNLPWDAYCDLRAKFNAAKVHAMNRDQSDLKRTIKNAKEILCCLAWEKNSDRLWANPPEDLPLSGAYQPEKRRVDLTTNSNAQRVCNKLFCALKVQTKSN